MVRFYHSNVDGISKSDVVIIGVPDESKSHATRKGTSRGPDIIRIASNQSDFF
jgi:agmatinase